MANPTCFGGNSSSVGIVVQGGSGHPAVIGSGYGDPPNGTLNPEANAQVKIEAAGTWSLLDMNVIVNGSQTITTSSRIGGVTGNQSCSVASGVTGQATDSTHSDSLSAGNLINLLVVVSAFFNSFTIGTHTHKFLPSSGSSQVMSSHAVNSNNAGASTTSNYPMFGGGSNTVYLQSGTGNLNAELRAAGTATFFYNFISSNTSTNAVTSTLEKTGADGNNTLSITAATTGAFEDSTHSDSYASTDTVYGKWVTGAGTSNTTIVTASILMTNTGTKWDHISQFLYGGAASAFSTSADSYAHFQGTPQIGPTTTETAAQQQYPFAANMSNARIYMNSNTGAGGNLTATFRKNAGAGSQTFSITQGSTGLFEDSTHTDTVAANDLVNFKITHPTTGTYSANRFSLTADSATSVNYSDSVTENMSLTDTPDVSMATYNSSVTENMSLTDTPDAEAVESGSVVDNMALTDTVTVISSYHDSVTENMALTDTVLASIYAEATHNVVTIWMNQLG